MKGFNCRVLLTTDLSARGIDAANVNLVINLEVPWDHNTYLHRVGRCGRFGSQGIAITIASQGQELQSLQEVSFLSKSQIYQLQKGENDEFDIPDLWRLKQAGKLEETLAALEILEEKEPEQKREDQPSIFEILKKSKKDRKKKKEKVTFEKEVEDFEQNEEAETTVQDDLNECTEDYEHQEYLDYNEWVPVENELPIQPDLSNWFPVTNEEEEIIEETDNEALEDEFLISNFELAIGRSLKKTKLEATTSNQEFKELLYKIHASQEPLESDTKRFTEIADQLIHERRQKRSKRLQKCREVLNSDVNVAIEDLMNGLVIKEEDDELESEQLIQTELVIKTELTSDNEQEPEQVVLFDLESGGLKVELDYEYGDPEGYLEDPGQPEEKDQVEDYSQVWNPFPDPDLGLPEDLYTLHANEWLRMQYQLWLDKVSRNKAMVEQHYLSQ